MSDLTDFAHRMREKAHEFTTAGMHSAARYLRELADELDPEPVTQEVKQEGTAGVEHSGA